MNELISNLNAIKQKITASLDEAGRPADAVKLLIVTKNRDIKAIEMLIAAKEHNLGENYLQEALMKINALQGRGVQWHFIGSIQLNKTRKIAENFSWVESVDSIQIAQRLSAQRPLHLPPLQVCIQVNIDADPNKGGIALTELDALAAAMVNLPQLQLRGLMTIPKKHGTLAERFQSYQRMRQAFKQLKLRYPTVDTLSMGMSDDFQLAITAGATEVRIGSAIFTG